jgi:ABC-2 type transport system permease protein
MTTVLPTTAPPSPTLAPGSDLAARVRWSWRLMRRGAGLIWFTVAAYTAIEVLVFRGAYPDAASRQKLLDLSTSTAVRMMQGVPGAVDTAGGFAVWDGGWMVMLIVACWSLLTATRLTRGEEDSGRAELVLSRPVTAEQVLAAHLITLGIGAAGVAVAGALPFIVLGEPVAGAMLWGLGLGSLAAVVAALGALAAQVAEPRRRAASLGFGFLAAAFVLRVVANSADGRIWLLTVAPFGWVERLRAFSVDQWVWLLAPLGTALALGTVGVAICGRRDTGAALLRSTGKHRSNLRLLGTASGFGWRLAVGALLAWTVALTVTALVFGLMTGALVDFIKEDKTYRDMLESMGMDMSVPAVGYLSYIALFLALPFAAFLAWRIGATRQEEADGRLDNLLVRGVVRWRWLAITTVYAFLSAVTLLAATTVALWAGAALADAPVTAWQLLEPMLGTLPIVALFTGIAVLAFGVAPRLTIALPVTLALLGYLLDTLGTALGWPRSVLGVSPFHHLARLPSQPMTTTAIVGMTALGVAAAAAGTVAFSRRDLRGA